MGCGNSVGTAQFGIGIIENKETNREWKRTNEIAKKSIKSKFQAHGFFSHLITLQLSSLLLLITQRMFKASKMNAARKTYPQGHINLA